MSPNGLATAVGFGVARIETGFESDGGSASDSFQIAVTPAGTLTVIGDVREPGQGLLPEYVCRASIRQIDAHRSSGHLYVGFYRWRIFYGSSIQFTPATSIPR